MASIYNLKGKREVVNEIILRTSETTGSRHLVVEQFPCGPGERDVNLKLEDKDVDAFIQLCECEAYGIEPELV
jgi:hypothetical protein